MPPGQSKLAILKTRLVNQLIEIDLANAFEHLQAFLIKFDEALIYIDLERREDIILYNRLIREINSQVQEIENMHESLK